MKIKQIISIKQLTKTQ